ncbi:hypothetical protein [Xenorhabdus sp. SGI240]|uniref:hypothetical protein n=1 Tax=Xenorhabdus sp. SGI240 TaxID=3158262 RepID=UPI0032B8605B
MKLNKISHSLSKNSGKNSPGLFAHWTALYPTALFPFPLSCPARREATSDTQPNRPTAL